MGSISKMVRKAVAHIEAAVNELEESETQLSAWYDWAYEGTGTTEVLDAIEEVMHGVSAAIDKLQEKSTDIDDLGRDIRELEEKEEMA